MKTLALVLLLILPVIAEGQDTTAQSGRYWMGNVGISMYDWTPRFLFNDLDSVVVIAAGDTVRTRGNAYLIGFQMLLLSKWDAYKAECYVDSSQSFREEGGVWHTCLVYGCTQQWDVPPTKVFDHWQHRDPTLSGFMEYIRRKVKP